MNEITIAIISAAIGYFWAMYRVENIKVSFKSENIINLDMKVFWQKAEEWKAKKDAGSVPK